ncbi:MAG: helix-turn-helix transcriptional regulator [Gammaproteobacteria bacterium]
MAIHAMNTLDRITGGELTLGKAIRAIRLGEDIKQSDFAKMIHVTQSYLSDLENDRKEVSPQKAAEIARILGYSEKQFIRLAVQDGLRRKGFHYEIEVRDAA